MHQFSVLKTLGHGTFGTSTLVKDPKEDYRAVKQVDVSHLLATESAAMQHEVLGLVQLSHPNILVCFGAFVDHSLLCIVWEFCHCGDLAVAVHERKEKSHRYTDNEAMTLFAQCLSGLANVHAKKILHRNLKCENVFLSRTGTAKIGDFGLSQFYGRSAAKAALMASPGHLAPEVCEGLGSCGASDIWSMGVVLYTLLALQAPFQSYSAAALVVKIRTADPRPLPSDVGEDVRAILGVTFQKQPQHRPSATQLCTMPGVRGSSGDDKTLAEQERYALASSLVANSLTTATGTLGVGGSPIEVTARSLMQQSSTPSLRDPESVTKARARNALERLLGDDEDGDWTPPAIFPTKHDDHRQRTQGQQANTNGDVVDELLGAVKKRAKRYSEQSRYSEQQSILSSLRDAPPLPGRLTRTGEYGGPFRTRPEDADLMSAGMLTGLTPQALHRQAEVEHRLHDPLMGETAEECLSRPGTSSFATQHSRASPLFFAGGALTGPTHSRHRNGSPPANTTDLWNAPHHGTSGLHERSRKTSSSTPDLHGVSAGRQIVGTPPRTSLPDCRQSSPSEEELLDRQCRDAHLDDLMDELLSRERRLCDPSSDFS